METPKPHEQPSQQHPQAHQNPHLLLDLSLSNKESDHHHHRSNLELNLIHRFDSNSSSETANTSPKGTSTTHDHDSNNTEPRVFSCNYCQRKFYSSQALGGHQNAHKRERTLAKKGHKSNSTTDHHHHAFNARLPNLLSHRFSSMASLPLHGSFNNRSLGIQVHSTIHKPSYYQSSSLRYGGHNSKSNNGWLRRQPIDQHPAIGRLVPQTNVFHVHGGVGSSSSSSSGGIGRFSSSTSGGKLFPATQGIGGLWWNGDSRVGHLKKDELQKLDLSLKL